MLLIRHNLYASGNCLTHSLSYFLSKLLVFCCFKINKNFPDKFLKNSEISTNQHSRHLYKNWRENRKSTTVPKHFTFSVASLDVVLNNFPLWEKLTWSTSSVCSDNVSVSTVGMWYRTRLTSSYQLFFPDANRPLVTCSSE